ncbi:MAG TPA: ankyrin repeat domain-containing protein [Candidatus Kapabacteria bacterium]
MKTSISAFLLFSVLLIQTSYSQDASTPEGLAAIQKRTRYIDDKPVKNFSDVIMKFKIKEREFSNTPPTIYEGIPYLSTSADIVVGVDGFNFKGVWGVEKYGSIDGSPCMTDKYMIMGFGQKKLVCANRLGDNAAIWEYETKAAVNTTPVVSKKMVFAGCKDGSVYGIMLEDGSFKWKFNAIMQPFSPAYENELIYVGTKQRLYVLKEKNGDVLWEYDGSSAAPIIGGDLIYTREKAGTVVALDKTTGSRVWSFKGELVEVSHDMALGPNILLVPNVTELVALDSRQGKSARWTKRFARPISGTPLIVGDVAYVPCTDWNLYALDLETGKILDNVDIGFSPEGSPAFAKGKLYCPSKEVLYTFEEESAGGDAAVSNTETATLFAAAEYGHLDHVKEFIEHNNESPLQRDDLGRTPLLLAAQYGHTDVVNYLIGKGAEVGDKNSAGKTALSLAAEYGRSETVKALLENGAIVEQTDTLGRTPLMYAAWYDHADVVTVLLTNRANINMQDNKGLTALMHGSMEGAVNACAELLVKGADINKLDKKGRNALIHTAWEGKDAMVDVLIAKGAKLDVQDEAGYTALMFAAENDFGSTCTLLVKNKANTKLKNKEGKTAYDLAKSLGKTTAATVLKGK